MTLKKIRLVVQAEHGVTSAGRSVTAAAARPPIRASSRVITRNQESSLFAHLTFRVTLTDISPFFGVFHLPLLFIAPLNPLALLFCHFAVLLSGPPSPFQAFFVWVSVSSLYFVIRSIDFFFGGVICFTTAVLCFINRNTSFFFYF